MCGYDQTHMSFKTKCYKMWKMWAINHFMFSTCSVSSKAVIFLWFIFNIYAFFYTVLSVPCSLVITCLERADPLALLCVMLPCVFATLSHWCLGQVWYLIVSIPDTCILLYFL